jgi:predicted dehydrogenase
MIKTAVIGYGFSAKTFHLPFIEASENFQRGQILGFKYREQKEAL